MKLVKVEKSELEAINKGRKGKWLVIVNEFLASGMDVAEVKDFDCSAVGAYHGLRYLASHSDLPFKPMIRNGRIFILRTDDTSSDGE